MPMEASRDETKRLLRRIGWRILPLLLLLYFIAYLDRINISFAATVMQRDLHFSDSLYGTGAGLFFLGALLAQVPSNLILARIAPRPEQLPADFRPLPAAIFRQLSFIHNPSGILTEMW